MEWTRSTNARRWTPTLTIPLWLLALASCAPKPPDSTQPEPTPLTVLSLNLRGVLDEPCRNSAGNWRFRYANVGTGLRTISATPDVIVLQEITGWIWCPTNYRTIPDYGPLDELLTNLESGTGIQYRIAYLNALVQVGGTGDCGIDGGVLGGCHVMSGLALLYNPRTIRNLMIDTPTGDAADAFAHNQAPQDGAHLQRSLPCCDPAQGSEVCTRIDGPAQTDKCGRETPAGLAWIAGSNVALARLERVGRPGTVFHVYNLHLPWQASLHPEAVSRTADMVNALEQRFGGSRWIPPIMTGDFNRDESTTLSEFPRFDSLGGGPSEDVIWVLSGKPTSFPASAAIVGHVTSTMPPTATGCKDPARLWSDHCGALTGFTVR